MELDRADKGDGADRRGYHVRAALHVGAEGARYLRYAAFSRLIDLRSSSASCTPCLSIMYKLQVIFTTRVNDVEKLLRPARRLFPQSTIQWILQHQVISAEAAPRKFRLYIEHSRLFRWSKEERVKPNYPKAAPRMARARQCSFSARRTVHSFKRSYYNACYEMIEK